ncbi:MULTISPECIES: exonuclease SbcCD subunit D [Bacillus]|uniref:exonuclease SbcCD subunit D n=1 Tax=Bacillus TaxID=1386 RepID=UPI0002D2A28C|nr:MULTISPECIES: exonuclease SbcCD subunit D [Bacillus]
MKFIHTADWHLGKIVHGIHMTENQREILQQFLQIVEVEKPDAIVIAGDLYDRSVPPTEAVELLDEILFQLNIKMNIPIVAITGNHDSAERLSFGSSWYKHSNLYIESKIEEEVTPIRIKGVNFYCVPYAEPGVVKQLYQDESISTHQDAMKSIVERIRRNMNTNQPNVLVGHAFVTGGITSDSERTLSVGGSGSVSSDLFAPFTYTALGHLHSPDAIHHPTIFYSGSLLKYSFSEAKQNKSINIVEMKEDGTFTVEKRPLIPEKDMREIIGYFHEIMEPAFYNQQSVNDYLKITLLDEGTILDPIQKLRQVYPNVLHLERKWDQKDIKNKQELNVLKGESKSELQLFESFYRQMTDREFDANKKKVMEKVISSVKKEVEVN